MEKSCNETIVAIKKIGVSCLYEAAKHFFASARKHTWSLIFSIPVIVINVLISSNAFLEITNKSKVVISIFSLTAAILAAVSGFLKLQGNSESHSNFGNQFRDLKKDINFFLAKHADGHIGTDEVIKTADEFKRRYNTLVNSAQKYRTNAKDYRNAQKSIGDGEQEYTDYELSL